MRDHHPGWFLLLQTLDHDIRPSADQHILHLAAFFVRPQRIREGTSATLAMGSRLARHDPFGHLWQPLLVFLGTNQNGTAMALPGIPQTFAVENALDMSNKLMWEIEAYRDEPELTPKLWRAFNCAVTAWHISDWLWKERRDEGLDVGSLSRFQKTMQARSGALRLCKHIATASKHGGVDRSPDLSIRVTIRAKNSAEELSFAEIDRSQHWEITICDHSGESDAIQVFWKALEFWDAEIRTDETRRDPDRFAPEH